jgi:diphthamide biosynthesis methyltransferase
VIESVTNRYYSIIRKAWRSYEFFSIITIAILLYIVSFHLNSDLLIIENSKIMNKLFSYFDLKIYKFTFTTISILYFFIYFTITKMVSKKAIKEQRRSVIEARSGSEHNADVAGAILNGTLGDFENEK